MKKAIVVLLVLFVVFGCESNKQEEQEAKKIDESTSKAVKEQKIAMDAIEEGLHIKDAWIRPAAKGRNTGLFFRIVNNTNAHDTLIGAESNLAKKTEVHETFQQGDMMGMREVEFLPIESGKVFEFKPMNHHVMLIQLNESLTSGDEGEVTLIFKNAGKVKVKAKVEDKMPTMKAGKKKKME